MTNEDYGLWIPSLAKKIWNSLGTDLFQFQEDCIAEGILAGWNFVTKAQGKVIKKKYLMGRMKFHMKKWLEKEQLILWETTSYDEHDPESESDNIEIHNHRDSSPIHYYGKEELASQDAQRKNLVENRKLLKIIMAESELTKKQRKILRLRFENNLSFGDIAKRFKVNKSSVICCYRRGIANLRKAAKALGMEIDTEITEITETETEKEND